MASIQRRVLIVGGGPTGAVTAFWLAKAGFDVTVAERATHRFAYGQGIDITGPALDIVRKMGLEKEIRSKTTGEGGFAILDDDANEIAVIGAASESGGNTLAITQEIEIMRGELTKILANAADTFNNVTYRYGCTISEIRQSEDCVTAVLSDSNKAEDFAVLIGADGLRSEVRNLLFDIKVTKDCYKPFDLYAAFFSMAGEKRDVPNAHLQHARGGRSIQIRPIDREPTRSSCYMFQTGTSEKLESVLAKSTDVRKAALAELFDDFPGLGKRALSGMKDANDFYFERIAQIKLDKWSNHRCVLVGDAAYAPSPLTGQGTALAILGSYVLAGELAANPDDPSAAFIKYDGVLRDHVKRSQAIPLGGTLPKLVNPSTEWGIYLLRTIFWLIAWTGVWKWISFGSKKQFALPKYDMKLPYKDSPQGIRP